MLYYILLFLPFITPILSESPINFFSDCAAWARGQNKICQGTQNRYFWCSLQEFGWNCGGEDTKTCSDSFNPSHNPFLSLLLCPQPIVCPKNTFEVSNYSKNLTVNRIPKDLYWVQEVVNSQRGTNGVEIGNFTVTGAEIVGFRRDNRGQYEQVMRYQDTIVPLEFGERIFIVAVCNEIWYEHCSYQLALKALKVDFEEMEENQRVKRVIILVSVWSGVALVVLVATLCYCFRKWKNSNKERYHKLGYKQNQTSEFTSTVSSEK